MRLDTRRLLHLLRAALLGLTLLALTFATVAYTEVHTAAEAADDRAVPMLREVSTARTALLRAHREVVRAFRTEAAALTGAGENYRDQLAVATQSLTRVAQLDASGPEGNRQLQLVDSLLAAYSGAVEQAAAQYRLPGSGPVLGTADLWQASRLLHAEDGVLHQLDAVIDTQWREFGNSLAGAAPTSLRVLSWALPGLALVLLLGAVQVLLAIRFRRRLNPWLLAATAVALAMVLLTGLVFGTQDRLAAAQTGLARLAGDRLAQDNEIQFEGQRWLAELVRRQCPAEPDCGPTVRAATAGLSQPPDGPEEPQLAAAAGAVDGQVREAEDRGAWWPVIPGLAALVMALVLLGFRARLAEYQTGARR